VISGHVIKIQSGRFYVETEKGVIDCFARGKLKTRDGAIITGDFVDVDDCVIVDVYPRKNELIRPRVANVDLLAIVISAVPKPDFHTVDKLIAYARQIGIETVIIVNKSDIKSDLYGIVAENYSAAVSVIREISALNGSGIDDLRRLLCGKVTVFAGQSAVGKTSVSNVLLGENRIVGELSEKTLRGKQTTTVSEIIENDGLKIVDTPGFSAFDARIRSEKLAYGYAEFAAFSHTCRFADCNHINEPDCGIKNAVLCGEINKERYRRYREIYKELSENEKNGKRY